MMPRDRPIMYIVYKYNMQKVLSFITAEVAGSTKGVITYLSKYHAMFSSFSIHTVYFSLVIYEFFVSVNEVKNLKCGRGQSH